MAAPRYRSISAIGNRVTIVAHAGTSGGTAPAARLEGEARLDVRQPDVIRTPATPVAVDRGPVRTVIIAAIDQKSPAKPEMSALDDTDLEKVTGGDNAVVLEHEPEASQKTVYKGFIEIASWSFGMTPH